MAVEYSGAFGGKVTIDGKVELLVTALCSIRAGGAVIVATVLGIEVKCGEEWFVFRSDKWVEEEVGADEWAAKGTEVGTTTVL